MKKNRSITPKQLDILLTVCDTLGMQSGARLLGEWIRITRRKQSEVAKMFGISAGYLSMFLSGERVPGREVALTIQKLAGIPVAAWSLIADNDGEMVTVSSASKSKRNKK